MNEQQLNEDTGGILWAIAKINERFGKAADSSLSQPPVDSKPPEKTGPAPAAVKQLIEAANEMAGYISVAEIMGVETVKDYLPMQVHKKTAARFLQALDALGSGVRESQTATDSQREQETLPLKEKMEQFE